jgi:hypothetical protein
MEVRSDDKADAMIGLPPVSELIGERPIDLRQEFTMSSSVMKAM